MCHPTNHEDDETWPGAVLRRRFVFVPVPESCTAIQKNKDMYAKYTVLIYTEFSHPAATLTKATVQHQIHVIDELIGIVIGIVCSHLVTYNCHLGWAIII